MGKRRRIVVAALALAALGGLALLAWLTLSGENRQHGLAGTLSSTTNGYYRGHYGYEVSADYIAIVAVKNKSRHTVYLASTTWCQVESQEGITHRFGRPNEVDSRSPDAVFANEQRMRAIAPNGSMTVYPTRFTNALSPGTPIPTPTNLSAVATRTARVGLDVAPEGMVEIPIGFSNRPRQFRVKLFCLRRRDPVRKAIGGLLTKLTANRLGPGLRA